MAIFLTHTGMKAEISDSMRITAFLNEYKASTSYYWDKSSPTRPTVAMVVLTLLTTVLIALAVVADPIPVKRSLVTLPISRRIQLKNLNLLEHDQLHAKALRAKGEARASGTPLSDRAVISSQAENQAVSYVASIGVGSPPTQCKRFYQIVTHYKLTNMSPSLQTALLLTLEGEQVACGFSMLQFSWLHSSNTWLGATKAYVKTSTSTQTANSVVRSRHLLIHQFLLSHWTNSRWHMAQVPSPVSTCWALRSDLN